ncbi:hypothetical protein HanIR_Chr03g0116571 [Helianthus annuus]|nr:hypothetical protein HanIR_Chr03g0116571 [Helianthus annuus]
MEPLLMMTPIISSLKQISFSSASDFFTTLPNLSPMQSNTASIHNCRGTPLILSHAILSYRISSPFHTFMLPNHSFHDSFSFIIVPFMSSTVSKIINNFNPPKYLTCESFRPNFLLNVLTSLSAPILCSSPIIDLPFHSV